MSPESLLNLLGEGCVCCPIRLYIQARGGYGWGRMDRSLTICLQSCEDESNECIILGVGSHELWIRDSIRQLCWSSSLLPVL